MRILGIGDYLDLGDLYVQLIAQGHSVRVFVASPKAHDIMVGMVERVDDWRAHLPWIRDAGDAGVIVCETAHHGAILDELRRDGYQVIGGCGLGDRLECDRAFGQQVMREAGMQVAPTFVFADVAAALAHLRQQPQRYVLKFDDSSDVVCSTYVGRANDGSDVAALLATQAARGGGRRVMLTQHLNGIEIGVGAYFNGQHFLSPACLDWEHKGFFPGGIGELTGEMGTLVTYRDAASLFTRTLARFAPLLREAGYCGYINLNLIVNEHGVWPLEFTCRFGYPGFAILAALQPDGWADLFQRMLDPDSTTFATTDEYAVGVVLCVPPFPYPDGYQRLGKGLPIAFTDVQPGDHPHFHLAEVARSGADLICAGQIGYAMVVTGCGPDARSAQQAAYARVNRVVIPQMRYRNDIGDSFIQGDEERLRAWGVLPTGTVLHAGACP